MPLFPGARAIHSFGSGQVDNSSSAFAGSVLQSPQTPEMIFAWYRDFLAQRSWTLFYDQPGATNQRSARYYNRGTRERFDVAVLNPALMADVFGDSPPTGTVFEISYSVLPNGQGYTPTPLLLKPPAK